MNIYYLGPNGSFSHQLAQKEFSGKIYKLIPSNSFQQIIDHIFQNKKSIGVLGIENSGSSSVHEAVDLVFNNELFIVGEASMEISLYLIGLKGGTKADIKDIYSHGQALAQCQEIMKRYNWKPHATQSTKSAVQYIMKSGDKSKAAIAGKNAIDDENLTVIEKEISDSKKNMTRWIFVSSKPFLTSQKINKQTYIFNVKHEPGSLVRVLQKIADLGGNLSKIESRPVPGSNWEYQFWTDVEIGENLDKKFFEMMKEQTQSVRLVGSYGRGKLYIE